MALIVDSEWSIDTQQYLCSSWFDETEKVLYGTRTFAAYAKVLQDHQHIAGHNVTSDLRQAVKWGIKLHKDFRIIDTLLFARALHPLYPAKDLKSLARLHLFDLVDQHTVTNPQLLLEYCTHDTYATAQLLQRFKEEVVQQELISIPTMKQNFLFARSFLMLELAGMKLDSVFLRKEHVRLDKQIQKGIKLFKNPLLITNDTVLLQALQQEYPQEVLDTYLLEYNGSYNVRAENIAMLPDKPGWLEPVMEAREAQQYQTLFVDNLLEYGDYVNPQFSLLLTRTHRRSTSPTMQNWPKSARRAVMSRFKDGIIIEADMKNLEARLFGWQAECYQFVDDMITQGYLGVAKRTLGTADIKNKKDPRYTQIKSTVLAVTYCMSPGLFAYREWIEAKGTKPRRKWKDVERNTYGTFFDAYPEIETEMERRKKFGRDNGYTDSWCGAYIPLPQFNEEYLYANGFTEKQIERYHKKLDNFSVNRPTQSMAAYVVGCALNDLMQKLVDYYMKGDYGAYARYCWSSRNSTDRGLSDIPVVIGEVHDALVVDTPAKEKKRVEQFIHEAMVQAVSLTPLLSKPLVDNILDVEIVASQYWGGHDK